MIRYVFKEQIIMVVSAKANCMPSKKVLRLTIEFLLRKLQ